MNLEWPSETVKIFIQYSVQCRPKRQENVRYKYWTCLS